MKLVRFGQVAELQRRLVDVAPAREYVEIGLRSFAKGAFLKAPTTGAEIGSKRVFHVHPGDLLLSNIFAWEGAVAVADERLRGTIGSHRFMTWRTNENAADARYLVHYFASDSGLAQLRVASPGSAGRNRTLSITALQEIQVPLPSLAEQRRLTDHLDAIENAAGAVPSPSDYERELQKVVIQLSGGDQHPHRPLRDLVERDREWIAVDPAREYEPIGVRGFGRGLIRYPLTPAGQLSKLRYFAIRPGNLVVSNIKAWEGAVAVASEQDRGRIASNRFLHYRTDASVVLSEYLRLYFTSPAGVEMLSSASPGSADRNRTLSMDNFEALNIPVPALDVQGHLVRLSRLVDRVIQARKRSNSLRSALLPAARNEIFSAMR